MPAVPFRGAIIGVSDRAMMARIYVVGIRKHPGSAWARETYEHVRRDLCGIYTEAEIDVYQDAGKRMMPLLSTQELDFVTAAAPTATHPGVWPRITVETPAELLQAACGWQNPETETGEWVLSDEQGWADMLGEDDDL